MDRIKRLRICQEHEEIRLDFGYSAVHKMYCSGFKIHAAVTPRGIAKTFGLPKASAHDIYYLNNPKQ